MRPSKRRPHGSPAAASAAAPASWYAPPPYWKARPEAKARPSSATMRPQSESARKGTPRQGWSGARPEVWESAWRRVKRPAAPSAVTRADTGSSSERRPSSASASTAAAASHLLADASGTAESGVSAPADASQTVTPPRSTTSAPPAAPVAATAPSSSAAASTYAGRQAAGAGARGAEAHPARARRAAWGRIRSAAAQPNGRAAARCTRSGKGLYCREMVAIRGLRIPSRGTVSLPSQAMSESSEPAVPITVLIVDDEELLVKSCAQILSNEGYTVYTEGRGRNALDNARRHRPDIVLTDLMLPDMDGLALLKEVKRLTPETLVVMITGFATVDSSVEAIRAGAYDYIPKPFTATQLRILIGRAAQQVQLVRDNAQLRDQLKKQYSFENIIGASESIQKVFSIVSRVAPTEASVFVSGESGTGKELIARAIHTNSRRSARPFVAINCAALPDHLLESELFGHEKGAFTGADVQRRGLLESAAGGTFFLDEITEMSMDLQAKLLRVIQERKIRRVGGEGEIPIDVRWVSATNRDPEQAVRENQLRQDLLYRLNVVPLKLPPLRSRREDIPALAQHFLRRYAQEYDRGQLRFAGESLRVLTEYEWPGNVRELQNVTERVVSLCLPGQEINPEDLPEELSARVGPGGRPALAFNADQPFHDAKSDAISMFEKEYLRDLLRRHGGNISQAARSAGIDRKTIHRMLSKYELEGRD